MRPARTEQPDVKRGFKSVIKTMCHWHQDEPRERLLLFIFPCVHTHFGATIFRTKFFQHSRICLICFIAHHHCLHSTSLFVTLRRSFLALCHRQLHPMCRHWRRGWPRACRSVLPTPTALMKAERSGRRRAGLCPSAGLSISPPSPSSSSSVVPLTAPPPFLPSRLDSINILCRSVNVVEVQWSDTRGSTAVIANQRTVISPAAASYSPPYLSPLSSLFDLSSFSHFGPSLSPSLWPSCSLSLSLPL